MRECAWDLLRNGRLAHAFTSLLWHPGNSGRYTALCGQTGERSPYKRSWMLDQRCPRCLSIAELQP